jgi:serine/threonine protein kinase
MAGFGSYEPTQSCFVQDDYNTNQLSAYLKSYLVDFLNNIEADPKFRVNVIGSPSEAGFVFKLKFNGIPIDGREVMQCYALKIMPITLKYQENKNELFFADYLSKLDGKKFALVYYQAESINLERKDHCITNIPVENWYIHSHAPDKIEKHKQIYDNVVVFNNTNGRKGETFICDIMVSRLYWGDLLAFINYPIQQTQGGIVSSRCEHVDFCGRLNSIKNSVEGWKELLIKILDTLQLLRENNIIHNDLHCGNILLDFDGTPVLHDFGLTRPYSPPKNVDSLYYGDTLDIRKLLNAISQEVVNMNLNECVSFYLNAITVEVNKYCQEELKIVDTTGLEVQELTRSFNPVTMPMDEYLKQVRNELFHTLKHIINADYVKPEFNLEVKLNELGVPLTTGYEVFLTLKQQLYRDGKKELFNEIKCWWSTNPTAVVTGGRKHYKKRKTNKKQKKRKISKKRKNKNMYL